MARFSGSTYSAAVEESKRLIALATLDNAQVDMSDYYSKTDIDNKFAAKVDLDTLTTSVNDKINKTDVVDNLTSTDTDKPLSANQGKVLKDEVDLKANDNDVVKKTDIVTTIDSSSTNDTVPTAKAVNELNIRGTLIDQSVVDKYGTEISKYPLGRWYFDSNDISKQFSDIPGRSEACIIEIYNTGNPWDNKWAYRNYKAQSATNKGTFIRQLESRDTAGVLFDTGWQRVCTTSVADTSGTATVSDGATGTITYKVINGVCYVAVQGLANSLNGNQVCNITGLPKPSIYVNESIEYRGERVGTIYCDYGNTTFTVHKISTNSGYGSFSYPVAES